MTFVHNIDPVIFSLGPLEVRWYGLMYVIGFFIVYFFLKHFIKTKRIDLSLKDLDNFMLVMVLGMLVGSRLFAVFVYNPSYYFAHPLEIVMFWKGGLSFHGALIGIVIAAFIFLKKKGLSFLKFADAIIIPGSLAQFFGRIGNFINAELCGKITTLPWAVKFPALQGFRHPSQLYEAFYNLLIFVVLFFYYRKSPRAGKVFALFLILYSIARISVEFVKDMPLYGLLTMGQWLSIPLFFIGLWLFFRKKDYFELLKDY